MDSLLEDLRKRVVQPGFDLKVFEKAFTDVPQNKRIPYMMDLLEFSGIKNPEAFKIMFVNILENQTSMDQKALLIPLLNPNKEDDKTTLKDLAEKVAVEQVSAGKKDILIPLLTKNPELLTTDFTNKIIRAAYESEVKAAENPNNSGEVKIGYTKAFAEQLKDIRLKAAEPSVAAPGEHAQKHGKQI